MPEEMIFNFVEKEKSAKIRVVGAGGAGGNAINNMIQANLEGVKFVVANTDAQALENSLAPLKLQIGERVTEGLGAGANPEKGREAAKESRDDIRMALEGSHMVFIAAGLGGGTGTGAAPVIAEVCKEMGILTVGVVTKPFKFEGPKRRKMADHGLKMLKEVADTVITIPNDRLRGLAEEDARAIDMFKRADEVLLNSVRGITDLIIKTGYVNLDFADVRTTMSKAGMALMGIGSAEGEDRAVKAAERALHHPLLEGISIAGARGVLMNISCSSDLKMSEMTQACDLIYEEAGDDAEIIWGHVVDDNMGAELRVTLIATGIGEDKDKPMPMPEAEPEPVPVPMMEEPKLAANDNVCSMGRGIVRDLTPEELKNTGDDYWDLPAYVRKRKGPATVAPVSRTSNHFPQNLNYDELDKPAFLRKPRD